MRTKKLTILLAGGGSGGHVYPLMAVCDQVGKIAEGANTLVDFHYVGRVDATSILLAEKCGIKMHSLLTAKVRRYFSLANLL